MRRVLGISLLSLVLCACVTINVYFPAAEAREAAREFVENVIGDEAAPAPAPAPGDGGMAMRQLRFDPWMLLGIGSAQAQAQPDITIRTPAIQAIQSRMESRFASALRPHFDSGALGFAGDGTVVVRDASRLAIKDRVAVNAAVANGHPEWDPQVGDVFARQWIASARPGWWYQQGGTWKQK